MSNAKDDTTNTRQTQETKSKLDLIHEFLNVVRDAGLNPPEVIEPEKIHRFHGASKDKSNLSAYCKIFADCEGGFFGDWADDDVRGEWHSKSKSSTSFEEQRLINQRIKEERAAIRKQQYDDAARKAKDIWIKSSLDFKNHPYLAKKSVNPHGIKTDGTSLIVPVMCNGSIQSLQFIRPDGSKRFLSGGKISEGHYNIGEVSSANRVCICEGFATAASVFEATGLPVVVAFNAGNIKAVAKMLREREPESTLIICADDDVGTEGNPGMTAAHDAARACNAMVVAPEFGNDRAEGMKDFNDMSRSMGHDAVKELINDEIMKNEKRKIDDSFIEDVAKMDDLYFYKEKASLAKVLKITAGELTKLRDKKLKENKSLCDCSGSHDEDENEDDFVRNKDGSITSNSANCERLLETDPSWDGVLGYNELTHRVIKKIPIPHSHGEAGEWTDTDDTLTLIWLNNKGINLSEQTVCAVVNAVAKRNKFNPIVDYLDSLRWDGVGRIDHWLHKYFSAENTRFNREAGSKYLIGAVARARNSGCKMDTALILEGEQGTRKSSALRILAGEEYFTDEYLAIGSKDSYMTIQGNWIVEMSELESLRKAEVEQIKQFLSRQVDRYRPPYGRLVIDQPRQCVLIGTTNNDTYLQDSTGHRRFWPVKITQVDLHQLARDRDQLWAEADNKYQQGESWWFDDTEDYVIEQQVKREVQDPWTDLIIDYLEVNLKREITTNDILANALEVTPDKRNRANEMRVGKIMVKLNWMKKRISRNGVRQYVYIRN